MKYIVKKTGRTWGIFIRGAESISPVEGGFFSRRAADDACDALNAEYINISNH